jgi:hypothetical protein
MFCVNEAQAAMIRTAFEQRGELSAVVELRRLFPGVGNIAWARECVRTIAGWQPLPVRQSRKRKFIERPRRARRPHAGFHDEPTMRRIG